MQTADNRLIIYNRYLYSMCVYANSIAWIMLYTVERQTDGQTDRDRQLLIALLPVDMLDVILYILDTQAETIATPSYNIPIFQSREPIYLCASMNSTWRGSLSDIEGDPCHQAHARMCRGVIHICRNNLPNYKDAYRRPIHIQLDRSEHNPSIYSTSVHTEGLYI